MFSKELEECLVAAQCDAKDWGHEYLCVEHILYAMLHHDAGIRIIQGCGGTIGPIKKDLEGFFKQQDAVENGEVIPNQTRAVQRVLHHSIMHVNSCGKPIVDIEDVLISIHRESQSYASYFLQKEGIVRLDLLNYVSHGISKEAIREEEKDSSAVEKEEKPSDGKSKKKDPLKRYTVDLTQQAEQEKLDPLIGREKEVERTIQILSRRRKNNPIYVGDPGVGKTALAEGLALRIFQKEVPELLLETKVFSLDIGALLAGTRFRGDFEQRIKAVLKALKKHTGAVLFIDEIHTIVGAGATTGGSIDVSNLLKPVLAQGTLRCMGSTTYEEYKKIFEKDRALSRRFQKIDVSEPSIRESIQILKGLKSRYEEHHGLRYTGSAIKSAVELSAKHINDRFLPDKAIDVIDEAGASVKLRTGVKRKSVTVQDIERVVAGIAQVPIERMSTTDRDKLKHLEQELKYQVFGQDEAIEVITKSIKRSRAGLGPLTRPIGSFLFMGPTGVGKTELAKQLAFIMGIHFTRFDMSEYMEKHTVSRLIGAPPGYVGFDQGGLLTDGVRKHPHCVLLLDEIEKAHPDVFNILLQVMDHATLTDNNGRKSDFRNVILIMTSNVGARGMASSVIGFGEGQPTFRSKQALEKAFTPEFRNRLDAIVPFNALPESVLHMIVDKLLLALESRLQPKKVILDVSDAAKDWIAKEGYDPVFGARPMARTIQEHLETPLSDEILFGKLEHGGEATIDVKEQKLRFKYLPLKKKKPTKKTELTPV